MCGLVLSIPYIELCKASITALAPKYEPPIPITNNISESFFILLRTVSYFLIEIFGCIFFV